METIVGMPQMDAVGLSENWLLRHCGECHWREMCRSYGAATHEILDERGERLYAAIGAVQTRYSIPLSAVRENDHLHTSISLRQFGSICFQSHIEVTAPLGVLEIDLISMFVARKHAGSNQLERGLPMPQLISDSERLTAQPELLGIRRNMLKQPPPVYEIGGVKLEQAIPIGTATYEPSPYMDFNGVGLLYFASYPTIVDNLDRRIIREANLANGLEWATATSSIARDVFFFSNINVGHSIRADLMQFRRAGRNVVLHTRLYAQHDATLLADVFTVKRWTAEAATESHSPRPS